MAPPPRMDPPGPVVVEVKFGFIELSAIDTINQSFRCRFFLDLTWEDPRLIGASSVPDGTWFPKGVYIINAHGALDIAAYSKPILVDSATGRVLWAQDIQGAITNQMSLAAFPFDMDVLEVYVHQAESARCACNRLLRRAQVRPWSASKESDSWSASPQVPIQAYINPLPKLSPTLTESRP